MLSTCSTGHKLRLLKQVDRIASEHQAYTVDNIHYSPGMYRHARSAADHVEISRHLQQAVAELVTLILRHLSEQLSSVRTQLLCGLLPLVSREVGL